MKTAAVTLAALNRELQFERSYWKQRAASAEIVNNAWYAATEGCGVPAMVQDAINIHNKNKEGRTQAQL